MSELKDFPYAVDESLPLSDLTDEYGVYETYGEDLEFIVKNHLNSNKLWTVCDSEISDDIIVCAGFRVANRINYIITDKPWANKDEVYKWT